MHWTCQGRCGRGGCAAASYSMPLQARLYALGRHILRCYSSCSPVYLRVGNRVSRANSRRLLSSRSSTRMIWSVRRHAVVMASGNGLLSTSIALCLALALGCAQRKGPTDRPTDDLTKALAVLERKVCLTIGDRTNGPGDQCEPHVDR